jgi:hypothetical protein
MSDSMKPIQGYHLITPGDPHWRPSNLMTIPNAGCLERTESEKEVFKRGMEEKSRQSDEKRADIYAKV